MAIPKLELIGVTGIPEIRPGECLGRTMATAARQQGTPLVETDVLVVAQKVVSKAEDRFVDLRTVQPSPFAFRFAAASGRDPRLVELVLRESLSIVRMDAGRGVLITETRHGFICANAGIDTSNVPGEDMVVLLPEDPDASARRLWEEVRAAANVERLGLIISDTFGRPWREGHTDFAIGVAGIEPVIDYRGTQDSFGKVLKVTQMALADELASAAEVIMAKATGIPAVIVRGLKFQPGPGNARRLMRERSGDLFR